MDKVINLKQRRKSKARDQKEKKAAENRVVFGRTKGEKQLKKLETERAAKHIEGHKRELVLKISHHESPDEGLIKQISDALNKHSVAIAGRKYERVNFVLGGYDEAGNLQAGLVGLLGWEWLFISMLWVADGYRHKGYGSQLISQAEKVAKENGCRGVFLDTMSFQAPDFYKKHGYAEFGRLDNFPAGHSRFWLSKTL